MGILVTYSIFYLIPPLMMVSIYALWKDSRHWRKYIWMYTALLTLLAFSFAPQTDSGDLYRYCSRLEIYEKYSFPEVLVRYPYREFGENLLCWIAAKLEMPGIMPGLAAFIVYGVTNYITFDYAERREKLDVANWMMFFELLILPFGSIVNNIFNVAAFAIVLLAAYRDLIQKKRNLFTILLYVSACFVQQAAFVLILARILAIPAKKMRIASIGIAAFLPWVINALYASRELFSGVPLIYSLINRGYYYLEETADSDYAIKVQTVLWYRLNFLVCMGFALLCIFVTIRLLKKAKKENEFVERGEQTFVSFLFLVGVLTISCVFFSAPHYWRFLLVDQMSLGIIMTLYFEDRFYSPCKYGFIALALGQFMIQIYRLFKSLVVFRKWMIEFLISSPLVIVFRILKKLVEL